MPCGNFLRTVMLFSGDLRGAQKRMPRLLAKGGHEKKAGGVPQASERCTLECFDLHLGGVRYLFDTRNHYHR